MAESLCCGQRSRRVLLPIHDCVPPGLPHVNTAFPAHKTKIVATIGPASESPEMLEKLIQAGLNVARLNFSHGEFTKHAEVVKRIRAASQAAGRRVAIMAD